jgi:hypothetical protein
VTEHAAATGSRTAQHIGVQRVAHHGQPAGRKAGAGDAFGEGLGEGFAEPVHLEPRQGVQKVVAEKPRLQRQPAFARGDEVGVGDDQGARAPVECPGQAAVQRGRPARSGEEQDRIGAVEGGWFGQRID